MGLPDNPASRGIVRWASEYGVQVQEVTCHTALLLWLQDTLPGNLATRGWMVRGRWCQSLHGIIAGPQRQSASRQCSVNCACSRVNVQDTAHPCYSALAVTLLSHAQLLSVLWLRCQRVLVPAVHPCWESPSVPHAVPATWLPPRTRLQPSHEHPHSGLLYQALLLQALCLVTICLESGQVSAVCVLAAAIVFPVDRFTEFWYPALRDGVNFVQVGCQICPHPPPQIASCQSAAVSPLPAANHGHDNLACWVASCTTICSLACRLEHPVGLSSTILAAPRPLSAPFVSRPQAHFCSSRACSCRCTRSTPAIREST